MPTTQLARLPLGLQTFAEVRELDCAYVDKTPLAVKMANEGKLYLLARPRRFGKSLFLDTLGNLFEAKRELFQGLYAENNWEWGVEYPVIKIDMSAGSYSLSDLKFALEDNLRYAASCLDVELSSSDGPAVLFQQLLRQAHARYGRQVVLLIDEYDKPIIDNIGDMGLAKQMRKQLHSFY